MLSVAGRIWYPATGYRNVSLGDLTGVGTDAYGFFWSETPISAGYAYCLYFSAGIVIPSTGPNSATGFSVRCVSEF